MIPPPPRSTLFPYTTLFRSTPDLIDALQATHQQPLQIEFRRRSEEHTSELQSLRHLVCRLLLEKKNAEAKQIEHLVLSSGYIVGNLVSLDERDALIRAGFAERRLDARRLFFFLNERGPPISTLFPYTTLFR